MPSETGIWNQEEADKGHLFSYRLAQWIGNLFEKHIAVYDFGCGKAAYVRYFKDIGFINALGIEGTKLKDTEAPTIVKDLTEEFEYPLVGNIICLEVGEHLPADKAHVLFDNIKNNCIKYGLVCLSWAVPGQDGDGHINCKPNHWVIEQMHERGFKFDELLTEEARKVIEGHVAYFRETILIFRNQ